MRVGGIASGLSAQYLGDLRGRLEEEQRKLATGLRAETYGGLGVDRGRALSLRAERSHVATFRQTIDLVSTRLGIASTAIERLRTIGTDTARDARMPAFDLVQGGKTQAQVAATARFEEMVAILNTDVDGRHLFSGRATDRPAVASAPAILQGEAGRAGLETVMAERRAADLGPTGLGYLDIPPAAGATVTITDTAPGIPFGFDIVGLTSGLSGAVMTPASGTGNAVSLDLSGALPLEGEGIRFVVALPDGSQEEVRLTASRDPLSGPGRFAIGPTPQATAAALREALVARLTEIAGTDLTAASAVTAARDFFGSPPQRVDTSGPLPALRDGSADTLVWYTGDRSVDGSGAPIVREAAVAMIDHELTVKYGMRADEAPIVEQMVQVATFAVFRFDASASGNANLWQSLRERVLDGLSADSTGEGLEALSVDVALSQARIESARTRHREGDAMLAGFQGDIEGISLEETSVRVLALQTQLQASLQTTSLMSRLSLVNYL